NCRAKDVYVKLLKHIPMGSGLGGGSGNAAGFILALEKAGVISKNDIAPLALSVGSDVLFFIYGGTAIVKGRGDVITPVEPLNGFSVELFFPGFSISTKEAYSKLKPEWFGKAPMSAQKLYEYYKEISKGIDRSTDNLQGEDLIKIREGTYNIFEKIMPDEVVWRIEKLRNKYPTALTGSGSTYFSIVPNGTFHFLDKGVEIYAFEKISS
ncbi:MAG: 4-(cytidine 5'-diphospho)-2-C-methyl-D-erythritol kinase, partial [Fervidobacterium sp.]